MALKDMITAESIWKTSMGLSFPGERVVFRGKDLFTELNDKTWMELLLYGITGKEFSFNQLKLFESIWVICTSYPDPRIWNNRVSALAATTRSTSCLAISASTAMSEAELYGRKPDIRAIDFLYRTQAKIEKGEDLSKIIADELEKFRAIYGFARPITKEDERNEPLIAKARELGLSNGKFLKLVFEVEKILIEKKLRMKANIAAIAAGLAADQGLSPREYYNYLLVSFSIGFITCYVDCTEKNENTFFPFKCENIEYEGDVDKNW